MGSAVSICARRAVGFAASGTKGLYRTDEIGNEELQEAYVGEDEEEAQ